MTEQWSNMVSFENRGFYSHKVYPFSRIPCYESPGASSSAFEAAESLRRRGPWFVYLFQPLNCLS